MRFTDLELETRGDAFLSGLSNMMYKVRFFPLLSLPLHSLCSGKRINFSQPLSNTDRQQDKLFKGSTTKEDGNTKYIKLPFYIFCYYKLKQNPPFLP